MAPAPAHESTRPRLRGGDLLAPSQLRRDRPRRAQPRDGAAAGRAAGGADARAQRAAGRGRLRADLPRAQPGLARTRRGARGDPDHPRRAPALSGLRPRPALEHGDEQRRAAAALRRRRSGAAGGAGQRRPPQPAPARRRAQHPQPRRMARPHAGAPAPPGRAHRRSGADRPPGRGAGLRRRRGAAGARIVGRHGDGAQDAGGWRDAVVLHHHPRLRHAGGGDALGAGDRVVPARRRRDRRGGAQVRGLPAL